MWCVQGPLTFSSWCVQGPLMFLLWCIQGLLLWSWCVQGQFLWWVQSPLMFYLWSWCIQVPLSCSWCLQGLLCHGVFKVIWCARGVFRAHWGCPGGPASRQGHSAGSAVCSGPCPSIGHRRSLEPTTAHQETAMPRQPSSSSPAPRGLQGDTGSDVKQWGHFLSDTNINNIASHLRPLGWRRGSSELLLPQGPPPHRCQGVELQGGGAPSPAGEIQVRCVRNVLIHQTINKL